MSNFSFYGSGLPEISLAELSGKLLVIEGADSAGRTTQAKLLQDAIERMGYPVVSLSLLRSSVIATELMTRLRTVHVCARTLTLFYATAFVDQLEQEILPALRAGSVVITNGYAHRLIAKSIILGASHDWLASLYGVALKPDAVIYLNVKPEALASRTFSQRVSLDNWSYGNIFERSKNVYRSFLEHQKQFDTAIHALESQFKFTELDGDRQITEIHQDIIKLVEPLL
jgi:dTMP kinase